MHRHVFRRKEIRAVTPFERCSPRLRPATKRLRIGLPRDEAYCPRSQNFAAAAATPDQFTPMGGAGCIYRQTKTKSAFGGPFGGRKLTTLPQHIPSPSPSLPIRDRRATGCIGTCRVHLPPPTRSRHRAPLRGRKDRSLRVSSLAHHQIGRLAIPALPQIRVFLPPTPLSADEGGAVVLQTHCTGDMPAMVRAPRGTRRPKGLRTAAADRASQGSSNHHIFGSKMLPCRTL